MTHPSTSKNLSGTKWTSTGPVQGYRHWEVVRIEGSFAQLRATLDPDTHHRVLWRHLRDRRHWAPGWTSTQDPK